MKTKRKGRNSCVRLRIKSSTDAARRQKLNRRSAGMSLSATNEPMRGETTALRAETERIAPAWVLEKCMYSVR